MKTELTIHDIVKIQDKWYVDIMGSTAPESTLYQDVPNPGIDITGCEPGNHNPHQINNLWCIQETARMERFLQDLKQHFRLVSDHCHPIEPYLK